MEKYILFILFITSSGYSFSQTVDYHFSTDVVHDQLLKTGKSYLSFIDNETLSSGIYYLKRGEEDKQEPHDKDELYYVVGGIAEINIEGTRYPAMPGDVLFVPAHTKHQFINIKEDLTLLVFFSKKTK